MRSFPAALFMLTMLLLPSKIAAMPPAPTPTPDAARECHELHDSQMYVESYYACYQAVDDFMRKAAESHDPILTYLRQIDVSTVIALDEAALGNHQDAYRWAVSAHQLAYYIYQNLNPTPPELALISESIQQLFEIETRESALIKKKRPSFRD